MEPSRCGRGGSAAGRSTVSRQQLGRLRLLVAPSSPRRAGQEELPSRLASARGRQTLRVRACRGALLPPGGPAAAMATRRLPARTWAAAGGAARAAPSLRPSAGGRSPRAWFGPFLLLRLLLLLLFLSGPKQQLPVAPSLQDAQATAGCPAPLPRRLALAAMEQPLVSTACSSGSCFAAVTVAGIVPADPDVLFRVFADPARAGRGVFTDVKVRR